MKKIVIIGIAVCVCLHFLGWYGGYKLGTKVCKNEAVSEEVEQAEHYDEFTALMSALMKVESNNNPDSVSPKGAAGILQLMPSYVDEANRILGVKVFSQDDRFDVRQSISMFTVVQRHYNPGKDIDKAIKLHNPKAGEWYANRVKSAMYDIARMYLINKKVDNGN